MSDPNRREFLARTSAAAAGLAIGAAGPVDQRGASTRPAPATPAPPAAPQPWFRRTLRWMQTNIAEIDPTRYDIAWWRTEWARTKTQGIIVNAGGLVAYYPTRIPLHRKAEFLGDRDLFGEILNTARQDGIVVLARMDSNGAGDATLKEHPDWFTRGPAGAPYEREPGLYVPCINGPYYREHIPGILREIAGGYKPEGFTDNSWSGLGRGSICYCPTCRLRFRREKSFDLPTRRDWTTPAFRAWIDWSYACRLEIWDLYNETAKAAGGPDCLWAGMMNGTIAAASTDFRDYREIARRSSIAMLDSQRRTDATGFQANAETGRLVHGLIGWDALAPESFALYDTAGATFRLSARAEPEVRLWALEGIAAGIQPWWHYVNAYHEDRRMYATPTATGQWHAANEAFLIGRTPVATVGVVYSQRHHDFFGREDAEAQVTLPQRGVQQALLRARIPHVLIHADDLGRDVEGYGLKTIVLPNLATMTDDQVAAARAFVARGGGLVATGLASACDRMGDARPDFALADVLGVHLPSPHPWRDEVTRRRLAAENVQSYLRLTPEWRAKTDGPHTAAEPPATGTRHPVLAGFNATDILPFGGTLPDLVVDPSATVLLTFVPAMPAFPPEAVWSKQTVTTIPGLIVREAAGAGRVAYFAADLDRRYARDNIGDIGDLIANAIRWTARDDMPVTVSGPGMIDVQMYRQENRLILHLVNLTNAGTWRGPVDELIPVGPIKVRVRLPAGVAARVRLLVSGRTSVPTIDRGAVVVELPSILDHEVIVVGS